MSANALAKACYWHPRIERPHTYCPVIWSRRPVNLSSTYFGQKTNGAFVETAAECRRS
jgi:hypothetical protein